MDCAAGRVVVEVVHRDDQHATLRGSENGQGQIGGLRDVVHAQVEVHDDVLLVEGFAVEELAEVDSGVVHVFSVVGVGRGGLAVVVLNGIEVVRGPVAGRTDVGGVLHGQVSDATGSWTRLV